MNAADTSKAFAKTPLTAAEQLRMRYESLTPRQHDVCRLMVQGLMSKQIADRLGASINTIKTHRNEVFRKLDAHSLVDLVHKIELIDRLPADAPSEASPAPTAAVRRPLQLLLVEDHAVLRDTLAEALERMGYGVFTVADGEAMDEILAAQQFDVVLLDIGLGEGRTDGLTLAGRLRRQAMTCGIVMISANSGVEMRVRSYDTGADAYLVKPINFQELDAVLQSLARRL